MIDLLRTRLETVQARIREACARANRAGDVTLVAVTKTVSTEVAKAIFDLGVTHLAESRPQELWKKQAAIPEATWHFIGHLQRNKIDKTAPLASLIHSVDSLRLLTALDEFAAKSNASLQALIEFNCSGEATKGGFTARELPAIIEVIARLKAVAVQGLMTMAAPHEDVELCRGSFRELRQLRDELRSKTGLAMPFLSMGMSNDFEIAIEEGATHVRLGSVLFEGLS